MQRTSSTHSLAGLGIDGITHRVADRIPLFDLLVALHLHLVLVQHSLQLTLGLLKVIVQLCQSLQSIQPSSALLSLQQ